MPKRRPISRPLPPRTSPPQLIYPMGCAFTWNRMATPSSSGYRLDGWQVTIPTSPPTLIGYGWKILPLRLGLELLEFEVKRNESSDTPASFKSTLRVVSSDGATATGSCWMNQPFSFPGRPLNTWTGQTCKISQASWNPENLDQSTVQILRDPGWLLK